MRANLGAQKTFSMTNFPYLIVYKRSVSEVYVAMNLLISFRTSSFFAAMKTEGYFTCMIYHLKVFDSDDQTSAHVTGIHEESWNEKEFLPQVLLRIIYLHLLTPVINSPFLLANDKMYSFLSVCLSR